MRSTPLPLTALLGLALALCLAPALRAQKPSDDPETFARELLSTLTPEAKAGQLFMSWILSREVGQKEERAKLEGYVRDVGLGGVILSLGERAEALALVERLQKAAPVPLLMAGDFENGLSFRFDDATDLGPNMLVGATRSEDLAYRAGRHTGHGARLLGFHWAFAPVLDVNDNPANPIINVRSYGADAGLVARLGAAFVRGVQDEGVLACGKHFPGHGNVSTDSHLAMATVPGTREQLMANELRPFAAAIDAGLGGIMSGHLAVPGLGVDADVPATLAPEILTGLLRDEMGFGGIVVTDALDMGGVKNALPPGEVAVRALLAGADMLLMPPDPVAARDAVLEAVRGGRLPEARLDEAVFRILRAKAHCGAFDPPGGESTPAAERAAAAGADPDLARRIAEAGVTLVRDRDGRVPLRGDGPVTVVDLLDAEGPGGRGVADALRAAGREVVHHRVTAKGSAKAIADAAAAVRTAHTVVVDLHVRVRAFSGTIAVPETLRPVVRELAARRDAIAVSFGNPYLLEGFADVGTYVCAYGTTPATEAAVAGMLLGSVLPRGRLPVGIPGQAPIGSGVQRWRNPAAGLGSASLADAGLDPELGEGIEALLDRAVSDRVFPGAVCLVARRGDVVVELAVGRETYADDAPPVRTESLFDLASLTKVCATTPALLTLVRDGEVGLDDPVANILPGFTGGGRDAVTLRHLLTHSSGLPAWKGFYAEASSRADVVRLALASELEAAPGERVKYSDIGLILLMACVEAVTREDFDHAVQRRVFDPLGMAGARFNTTGVALPGAVPTEVVAQRGGLVDGLVHDENAWAMGGISGHAGLFATARDVARLGNAFLGGGADGWLPVSLVAQAIRPQGIPADSGRCLGWDHPGPGSWAGTSPPPRLFAHTGFTGTSVWCDPDTGLCVVLLTNRVHPTRQEKRHTALRRAVHDLVQRSVRG